jgi:hypothetical protein
MFSSGILDVAIGMAFVYLLLSLLCTAINEWIAALFNLRGTNLEKGIRSLFSDGKFVGGKDIADVLYAHGLVKSMYRDKTLPSYIPSRTFALALLDTLAPADASGSKTVSDILVGVRDKLPDGPAKETLFTVISQAQDNVENARKAVEDWYNSGMDRVSGWYKRKTQIILIILAAVIAVGTNTDSVLVGQTLWNSPALRDATAKAGEQFVQNHKDDANQSSVDAEQAARNVRAYDNQIKDLGLPVGWSLKSDDPRTFPCRDGWLAVSRVLGWLITAIAVSFGAPFWFDTLNKFMVVRSTVKPKEKSQEEATKDAKPDTPPAAAR